MVRNEFDIRFVIRNFAPVGESVEPVRSGLPVWENVLIEIIRILADWPAVVVFAAIVSQTSSHFASGFEVLADYGGLRIFGFKEIAKAFEERNVRAPSGIEIAFHVPRISERRFDVQGPVGMVNAYAIPHAYGFAIFRIEFFFGEQIGSAESFVVFRKVGEIPLLQSGNEFLRIHRGGDPEEIATVVCHVRYG